MAKREIVVLFATIKTKLPKKVVMRNDPETRFRDVIESTIQWNLFATSSKKDLIILENSGSAEELQIELDRISMKDVKVFSVPESEESEFQGISIGEYEMMQYLNRRVDLDKYDFIWKAPGRNFVPNARKVITWDGKSDMVFSRNWKPQHFVATRLFGMRTQLWKEMVERGCSFDMKLETISPKIYQSMEHFLTQFVLDQEAIGRRQVDFNQIPRFTGFSGSTGKEIDNRKRRIFLYLINPIRHLVTKMLLGDTP